MRLSDLRPYYSGASLDEARANAGRLNARLAGREEEYLAALVLPPAPAPRHDDRQAAAAAAARRASGESARADAVARALVAFDEGELAAAFALAGLAEPQKQLRRMVETQVVFEPRPGRYRALP